MANLNAANAVNGTSVVRLDEARSKDVPAIAALGRATFASSFGHSMPASDMQAYLASTYADAAIRKEFDDADANIWRVARLSDGTVVGFVQLKRGTTEPCLPEDLHLIELHRIYVSNQHHGLGIGGKLLAQAMAEARAEPGCQGIWLGVWDENVRAQRFYHSFGFTEKVGKHAFTIGECTQWDFIFLHRFPVEDSQEQGAGNASSSA